MFKRFKNDQQLTTGGKIKLETRLKSIHTIAIDNVLPTDVGRYVIKAKNDIGEATECFDLTIQSI